MRIQEFADIYLQEVKAIAESIDREQLSSFITILRSCKQTEGRLFVVGVGGSAANASHAVNDFRKICNIEAYSVSENVSELTARINDESWDTCYSNWLQGSRLNKNDVLLVFSVGGGNVTTSQNIVQAVKLAKERNSKVISVVSRDGGVTREKSDACIHIPSIEGSRITAHAEEWQGIILHLIVNYFSLYEN